MIKFSDIKCFPKACYEITIDWRSLRNHLARENDDLNFNMDPEYQRGYVWTEDQQVKYVEYCLKGGESGNTILTNCPGWMSTFEGPYELIDGKQRITAVLSFLKGTLKVFGGNTINDFDNIRLSNCSFKWRVFALDKREDILRLYLDINSGGTPHSAEEIERVRELLNKERNNG